MTKYIYSFGDGKAEGDASQTNLLGGKGANLAEIALAPCQEWCRLLLMLVYLLRQFQGWLIRQAMDGLFMMFI